MATKVSQVLEVFLTTLAFFLAYSTISVASAPFNQTVIDEYVKSIPINQIEIDEWFKSFSTDPTHLWYQQVLPQEPRRGFYLFGKNCLDGVGNKKCVRQLFDGLFDESKVDNTCLCKLKKMEILCTMTIAGTTGHMDKYKNDATRIYERAHKIIATVDKLHDCPAA